MRFLRSEKLPWWVVEVCSTLDKPTTLLDHGAELGLVAAVNDALAWARDPRPYEKKHKRSWESVIDDFKATARRVGTESQFGTAIETGLTTAVNALEVPDGPKAEDAKKRAEVALQALLSRSLNAEAVTAAWDDLIMVSQDESAPALEWAWRRNAFLDLAAHAGRGVPTLVGTLAGVLDDRLLEVTSAQVQLGEVEAPSRGGWPTLEEAAGLSESERLELCRRLIAVDPVPTQCVVCVGFDHARLAARTKVTDQIVFYPAPVAKELLGVGDVSDSGPIALIPTAAEHFLPSGDDEVLAVIDLGIVNPATAVAVGASNCEALVALVNASLRQPTWQAMTGHVLSANGWSASSFARSDRSLPPHWADPMGTRLASLGSAVGGHLPVASSVLQRVVAASHRLLAAQNESVDPADRLLITVGLINEAAGWASSLPTDWNKVAEPFGPAWAEATLQSDLFKVVAGAIDPSFDVDVEQEKIEELELLRSAIRADQPDGGFVLSMRAACENLPALAALVPVGSDGGRQLATLRRHLADGPSLAAHLEQRSEGHQRLLSRALRCRNAAAHAGPLPSDTVESVLEWAKVVATSLRQAGFDAFLTDSGGDTRAHIGEAHRRIAEAASNRTKALANGADVARTLFPEEGV